MFQLGQFHCPKSHGIAYRSLHSVGCAIPGGRCLAMALGARTVDGGEFCRRLRFAAARAGEPVAGYVRADRSGVWCTAWWALWRALCVRRWVVGPRRIMSGLIGDQVIAPRLPTLIWARYGLLLTEFGPEDRALPASLDLSPLLYPRVGAHYAGAGARCRGCARRGASDCETFNAPTGA